MQQLDEEIDKMLSMAPYSMEPRDKQAALVGLLKEQLNRGSQIHAGYKNYIDQWPVDYRSASCTADLPYLPVGILKANPPLSFVASADVKRTLTSSATTSQMPSRVVLDAPTSRRMTKGVVTVVRDFIGSLRRPYLVVDTPELMRRGEAMGARSAAIQGLNPFASTTTYCLNSSESGELTLDVEKVKLFADTHRGDAEVLVYGFTYILWKHLAEPLLAEGICLNMPNVRVLHSGGWKRLQDQAVEKHIFNEQLAKVFGCSPRSIIDFYGMVESVGVIFPDCPEGNKHSPAFGDVIVRNPLTLEPVAVGKHGIVEVCSILPTSFPGNLLLTEDMAEVVAEDCCPCGRRGISFRFAGRIPKAEVRGCGNIQVKRAMAK